MISDTPLRIYDPTRDEVLAHELVNETVMEEYTVIPMSFGTHFARVQLGRMIESALESTAADHLNDIHQSLAPVASASRTNKPIGDRMIMNAAYLVDRAEEEEFDRAVKELGRRYEEVLTFRTCSWWTATRSSSPRGPSGR